MARVRWNNVTNLSPKTFTCGYCGKVVGSENGFNAGSLDPRHPVHWYSYVCPYCYKPTFFEDDIQIPGVAPGVDVSNVPDDVDKLYREARNCVAIGSYTAAVLTLRKLLMHIAVSQNAEAGKSYLEYVNYLADNGFVPPNGKGWVDHIRLKGNEANHEIRVQGKPDAEELIIFIEMLLKFIYEFPSRIPKKP